MPSPFPGMDPYLETPSIWSDFHLTMLVTIRAELNRVLPDRYAALVPLTPSDPDIPLDLARWLNRAFDEAQYGRVVNDTIPLLPPLVELGKTWAKELLNQTSSTLAPPFTQENRS